jgi:dTDP-glucose pyrophosphorylase
MVNIVIPMAGKGRRFVMAGYREPKPLIDVQGRPMLIWALQGISQISSSSLTFIVHRDHVREHRIDSRLREIFPPSVRILIEEGDSPPGQAGSVLKAKEIIDTNEPLIIHNCDTCAPLAWQALRSAIRKCAEVDGFIPVFPSSDPGLSYVEIDAEGNALRVAEKEVISEHATIGMYHFARGRDFVRAAEQMIARGSSVRGEYYVLPAYQYLIDRGLLFRLVDAGPVSVLGTPEGLADFKPGALESGAPGS